MPRRYIDEYTKRVMRNTVNGRPRSLNAFHVNYLVSLIDRTPDLYLWELRNLFCNAFNCDVDERTIRNELRRHGFTRKKVTRPALEANDEAQTQYKLRITTRYRPEYLVFLDESASNLLTHRRPYAWSRSGTRARRHDVHLRGKRYSILPAMSLDGVLHVDVIDRPYTSALFRDFVDGLLDKMNPFPNKNSVLIMDNASIHKSRELQEMVEQRGMRLEYLPAYSPDYNPLEEGFSSIKACLRRNRDWVHTEMTSQNPFDPYLLLFSVVFECLTPDNALGWFHNSNYL